MKSVSQVKPVAKKRLNIIKGQIEGLGKMIEQDVYCVEILNQSLAVQNSLKSLDSVILEGHLKTHSAHQFKKGDPAAVKELLTLFKRNSKA